MDNSSFEQQFTQNVKASAAQPYTPSYAPPRPNSSKLPLITTIALAAVTFVESLVLIITLSNYFAMANSLDESYEEDSTSSNTSEAEVTDDDENYAYDEEGNVTAFEATCTNEEGASYKLTKNNSYEQYTSSSSLLGSGTYTILYDSIVSISGSDKTLYFDGMILADGTNIYECEYQNSQTTEE